MKGAHLGEDDARCNGVAPEFAVVEAMAEHRFIQEGWGGKSVPNFNFIRFSVFHNHFLAGFPEHSLQKESIQQPIFYVCSNTG